MFLCFGFLLIDRTLSKAPGVTRTTGKFEEFLRVIPACATPLKDALVSKGHQLMFGDDETFFNEERLDILEACSAPVGSKSTHKTRGSIYSPLMGLFFYVQRRRDLGYVK